jgi:FXSXX-COOH protein
MQVTAMNAADDRESAFTSEVADLRRVPLGAVSADSKSAVSGALRRVLREESAHKVPVAAFNSSI